MLVSDRATRTVPKMAASARQKFSSPSTVVKMLGLPHGLLDECSEMANSNLPSRLRFTPSSGKTKCRAFNASNYPGPYQACHKRRLAEAPTDNPVANDTVPFPVEQFAAITIGAGVLPLNDCVFIMSYEKSHTQKLTSSNVMVACVGPHKAYVGNVTSTKVDGVRAETRKSNIAGQSALQEAVDAKWLEPGTSAWEYSESVCEILCEVPFNELLRDGGERISGCTGHRQGAKTVSGGAHPNCTPGFSTCLNILSDTAGDLCRDSKHYVLHVQCLLSMHVAMMTFAMELCPLDEAPAALHLILRPRSLEAFPPTYSGKFNFTSRRGTMLFDPQNPILHSPRDLFMCPSEVSAPPQPLCVNTKMQQVGGAGVVQASAWEMYRRGTKHTTSNVYPQVTERRARLPPIVSHHVMEDVDIVVWVRNMVGYFLLDRLTTILRSANQQGCMTVENMTALIDRRVFWPFRDHCPNGKPGSSFAKLLREAGRSYGMASGDFVQARRCDAS